MSWPLTFAVLAAPAVACGGLLALTAGPRWRSLLRADWKRLLLYYIGASVIAALILVGLNEHVVSYYIRGEINPLFNKDHAWPIALITYSAVVLACGGIWMAAFQVYSRSNNVLKNRECWSGLASLAGVVVALAAATQLLTANGITLLGDNSDGKTWLANIVRSGSKTRSPQTLEFHGFYFVGPRSALKHQWDRLVLQSDDWRPRLGHQQTMFDNDIEVGVTTAEDQRPPDCRALSETRTVCADLKRANINISGSRANIDAYLYDAALPEAALSFAYGASTATATITDLQAEYGSECRLQMVGVPFDGLTTKAWIGCADWLREARRLKELVTPWFAKTPR